LVSAALTDTGAEASHHETAMKMIVLKMNPFDSRGLRRMIVQPFQKDETNQTRSWFRSTSRQLRKFDQLCYQPDDVIRPCGQLMASHNKSNEHRREACV
jgi:hypothetical protein